MKKRFVFVICCLILILSLSVISAFSFSEFWKKFTGQVVDANCKEIGGDYCGIYLDNANNLGDGICDYYGCWKCKDGFVFENGKGVEKSEEKPIEEVKEMHLTDEFVEEELKVATENKKDMTKYSDRDVVLISDKNWISCFEKEERIFVKYKFWFWTKMKTYKDFCFGDDEFRDYFCDGEKPYYANYKCENCCDEGVCVKETEVYQCSGEVKNSLCYNHLGNKEDISSIFNYGAFDEIKIHPSFENKDYKLIFDYPLKTKVHEEFELKIEIQNKKNENLNILYNYDVFDNSYLIVKEQNDFLGMISGSKYKKITIPTHDKKIMTIKIKPNENNVLREKFFDFYIEDIEKSFTLEKIIDPLEGVNCGERLFPEEIPIWCDRLLCNGYFNYKCCDNVFYPEFECCSDSDCLKGKNVDKNYQKGKCIDGMCLNKMEYFIDPAIGNKNGLIVMLDDYTSSNKCEDKSNSENFNDVNVKNILDLNEKYYDRLANIYLKEDENFINFRWRVIGNFKLEDFNLSFLKDGRNNQEIIKRLSRECNLDITDFDEIILVVGNRLSFGVSGYAGRPILMGLLTQPTFSHEIGHNFGALDLYNTGSGHLYQWGNSIYSPQHDVNLMDQLKLPIGRGEIGWADLNENGVFEIKEYSWQPERIIISDFNLELYNFEKGCYKLPDTTVLGEENRELKPIINQVNVYILELNSNGDMLDIIEFHNHDSLTITISTNFSYTDDNWERQTISAQKTRRCFRDGYCV